VNEEGKKDLFLKINRL